MDLDEAQTVKNPFNLGNPGEFSMLELAELILSITGSKSNIEFHELPEDDPKQRCPNIGAAKKCLDWVPEVSLKEGLKETINYFEAII